MYRKLLTVCLIVLFLAACAPAAPTTAILTDTPPPAPATKPANTRVPTPTTAPYNGTYQVGEFKMTIGCAGSGEPTIILENGLGGRSWVDLDLDRFKGFTRACWYVRVGLLPVNEIKTPQTTMDQVKALHSLLEQAGVPGPYILVGHSIAGLNMPLFANQYPEEVVGMVCVDCYPALYGRFLTEKLINNDTFNPQDIKDYLDNYEWDREPNNNLEHLDIAASEEQVMKVTSLGDIPFVALVRGGERWGTFYNLDLQLDKYIGSNWLMLEQELCAMSSRCRLEVVAGTNHNSLVQNEAVDKAVKEVYDAAKKP